jgi:(E)-4-hydroxy-3-methylbut-2-enyl-diphosphate synthase
MNKDQKYCNSLIDYSRLKTREVAIGNVNFGGDNPIRLQSMTTVDTMDTEASVAQAIRMIEAGCELVRYTAPSIKEAENLKIIREELTKLGITTPIVADIHFTPNAAEVAALHIEKVRVNPGNYADKKKFEEIEYTDESYQAELNRIREKFTPLVLLCKKLNRAMRIGTNHGSLSDRITSRYGDTPEGMVESAMEFIRICEDNEFYDLVISMKSSNTQVMVQAYRILASKMLENGRVYPLHLGVTEAGEGEDGRIKSAVGIGALLTDGIGDTIRVSLTEEPEFEIPVARKLAVHYGGEGYNDKPIDEFTGDLPYNPFEYSRRKTNSIKNIGGHQVPVVMSKLNQPGPVKPSYFYAFGYSYQVNDDKWHLKDQVSDYIYTGNEIPDFELPGTLGIICNASIWQNKNQVYPIFELHDFLETERISDELNFVWINGDQWPAVAEIQKQADKFKNVVLVLRTINKRSAAEMRRFFMELMQREVLNPVILERSFVGLDDETFQINSAADLGILFLDGMGDGIFLSAEQGSSLQVINSTAFGILQATRTRISKTEYISCPSCGRTLFDLQETTGKIRAKTSHLKGLKIGIMGCIVNGPGEMADADYGYVGVGKGKINLYKEKTVVKKNVAEDDAVDELINLIKEYGDWVDEKLSEN